MEWKAGQEVRKSFDVFCNEGEKEEKEKRLTASSGSSPL
jgi:hypothetical protein